MKVLRKTEKVEAAAGDKEKHGDMAPEELCETAKEIRAGLYSILGNLVYQRKDNAKAILIEKQIWKGIANDAKRTETGCAELRATSVGLLISSLEIIEDFEVTPLLKMQNDREWTRKRSKDV